MMKRARCIDLFAGVGGFGRALQPIFQTVAYVELDPTACKVLRTLMQKQKLDTAPILNDVRLIDRHSLKALDPEVITAGFPCQDISIASHNARSKGVDGERSGLVHEIIRIVACCPSMKAVLLENSNHILKRGLQTILQHLTSLGFQVVYGIFSAHETGALHLRRRWFCLATRGKISLTHCPDGHLKWKSPDSVPRVLPRLQRDRREVLQRCALLGNAVVPACVVYAYNKLLTTLHEHPHYKHTVSGSLPLCHLQGYILWCTDRPTRPVGCFPTVVISEKPKYVKYLWATPTHSHWVQYRNITPESNVRKLVTQIFWDDNTQKFIRQRYKYSGTAAETDKFFNLNPEWIELLMGFPRKWTEISIA